VTDTPTERDAESIWTSLRRRKVVQWGLVYVAAAWGFLQGLEYVSEAFEWPTQLRQVALLLLLIGLPIVLVLAWYHGDRGQQRITTPEFAILTLLLLLGGGAFWYYQRASEVDATPSTPAGPATASPLDRAVAPNDQSIAVLPFADMSPEKDQEYMSDGIAEELLNLLAKVPDLKVIARTSSFAFKGQNVEVAEIAKRLNVAHLLEGSVRKSGNTVRITAQLIRTSDSMHLWSERYDRPLDDIFAVQDEIAKAIVQALQIRLMGDTLGGPEVGAQNLEAYELYLRAVNARNQNTQSSLDAAIEYLQRAVELEPGYGMAWSLMAEAILLKTDSGWLQSTEGYEQARQLAQHALQVSPDNVHAHAMLLYVHRTLDWDWAAAEADGQRALAIDPTNPTVLGYMALISRTLGRWGDAEGQLRAALARDPLNPLVISDLAGTYYRAGRYAESEALNRKLLELQPDFAWARYGLARTLLAQGKPDSALAVLQQEGNKGNRLQILPIILQAAGRQVEADEALEEQIAHWADTGAFYVARTYAFRGDHERSLQWLERAYKQKDPGLADLVGEHAFSNIADDPRFKAFLRKMNLPEWPRV
jgi:TolB-like protein/Flp pilus assembly protein TadD